MKRVWLSLALFGASAAACAPPPARTGGARPSDAGASESHATSASPRSATPQAASARATSASDAGSERAIPVSWVLAEHAEGPGCFGLSRPDELLCRADRRVIQARAVGDEKLVACYRRRGSELRTAYRIAEATREHLHSNSEYASIDRERLAAAEQALERDYASLESCAGPRGLEKDSVRVIVPQLPSDG